MNAAAFSTGISVRWPRVDRVRAAAASDAAFAPPADEASAEVEAAPATTHGDDDNYSYCQELAFQYAVEQTKSAVRAVLLQANANCYQQVLRYFERFMRRPTASSAPVVYPELHGFPTAAIVAGTDATFSEVWVTPLCQVLQRSFPLVFVVREDFQNARRMLEWIAEQLDAVKRTRELEEDWLVALIDGFDLLDPDAATEKRVLPTRRAAVRNRAPTSNARGRGGSKQRGASAASDDGCDDDFVVFEGGSGDDTNKSSDDDGNERRASTKKRRLSGPRSSGGRTKAKGVGDRAYSKWTIGELLTRIQADLESLMGCDDPCKTWTAALHDLIDERLQSALHDHPDDLEAAIKSYNDVIDWIKARIGDCRALSGSGSMTAGSMREWSTEFSLAQILHEVMKKFIAFLSPAITPNPAATDPSTENELTDSKKNHALADLWRRRISGFLKRHEDYYQLHHFDGMQREESTCCTPFLLVCIEQLETFSQQVLDDFLVTWTNFSRQIAQASAAGAERSAFEIGSRLGFIVGVSSTASPALRHLNLSIVSQIDMQFFALEDSRKCFDDILEALVVDANLPLCLGGDVMRWIAARHRTTQSITMFIHALQFLFFAHFKNVRWSFLSHFCLSAHWNKPLQSVQFPSKHLAQWMRRNALRASTMHDYLLLFSDGKLEELRRLVYSNGAARGDWLEEVLDEMSWLRHQRASWAVGWKCFRAACSWLDIELRGDDFTTYLALALDGKLANTTKIHMIVQKLGTCSLRIAMCLLEDWRSMCQSSSRESANIDGDAKHSPLSSLWALLDELVLVCRYASETQSLSTTQKMITRLRQEIQDTFVDKLIIGLVQPPRPRPKRPRVLQWVTATNAKLLEDRLHINYYDKLKEMLLEIEDGAYGGGHTEGTSWVNDVSLAFLYYQESAGIYLSLRDWYDAFADALRDEFAASDRKGVKKRKTSSNAEEEADDVEVETKARFLRAFCTLRHWGFVKSIGSSQSSDGDTIEKIVFI